jgi:hypothetical protein
MNILTKMSDTFFRKGDYRTFLLRKLPQKSVGCELGVWKGDFSREIVRTVNPKKLYLIDPWSYQPDCPDSWYGGTNAKTQIDMDEIYLSVKRLFSKNKNVQILRKKTEELHDEISDNELDWAYIDGNHQFEYVLKDLHYFSRKVKDGGIICGDDYDRGKKEPYPITEAVKKFLQENRTYALLWVKNNQFFLQKKL